MSKKIASRLNDGLAFAGVALLVLALTLITNNEPYPYFWALIPVGSAVLLIFTGPQTIVGRILSQKFLVWIGLISFPLYLWHWPIVSFARIVTGGAIDDLEKLLLIFVSIGLAWATYKLCEKPIRHSTRKITTPALLISLIILAMVAIVPWRIQGLISQRPVVLANGQLFSGGSPNIDFPISQGCGLKSGSELANSCEIDERPSLRFGLIGDSKAGALNYGLFNTSSPNGRWISFKGVLPIDSKFANKEQQNLSEDAYQYLGKQDEVSVVVIAHAARSFFSIINDKSIANLPNATEKELESAKESMIASAEALVSQGKKVVFLVDNPTLSSPEDCAGRVTGISQIDFIFNLPRFGEGCQIKLETYRRAQENYLASLEYVVSKSPESIAIFDPTNILCSQRDNLCSHVKFGKEMYSYTDHISYAASELIGLKLNEFVLNFSNIN